jgi:hypothetical protein
MGQAPRVAVLAEGVRGTMITLAVAKDAVGAPHIKLRKEKLEISAIAIT